MGQQGSNNHWRQHNGEDAREEDREERVRQKQPLVKITFGCHGINRNRQEGS